MLGNVRRMLQGNKRIVREMQLFIFYRRRDATSVKFKVTKRKLGRIVAHCLNIETCVT
jgi:hypothetical protein